MLLEGCNSFICSAQPQTCPNISNNSIASPTVDNKERILINLNIIKLWGGKKKAKNKDKKWRLGATDRKADAFSECIYVATIPCLFHAAKLVLDKSSHSEWDRKETRREKEIQREI
jgi:hypothetical protein